MEIISEGLIIAKHKFKENSNIVTLFTNNKGILKGVYKGSNSKKNFYLLQLGNIINATWHARLEDHLGTFKLELKKSNMPTVLNHMPKLLTLKTVCELIYTLLAEKDAMPALYEATIGFLDSLSLDNFFNHYIKWELTLLKYLGYGLDFSKCVVCNEAHELAYVSPKTGAGVCTKVGDPHKSKLLVIPKFFNYNNIVISNAEKQEALTLTGYFINRICLNYNKTMPYSRNMLVNMVNEK